MLVTLIYHRKLDDDWNIKALELSDKFNIKIIGRSRKQKVILENGISKRVQIGKWIDNLMFTGDTSKVESYPKDNNLQVLKVKNCYIPTLDSIGTTSWGKLTAVTRHDPGKTLYKIITYLGRSITVAESNSLLIWDAEMGEFLPQNSPDVKIGDYVPIARNLPEPPVIKSYINTNFYFPKSKYIHGTDILMQILPKLMSQAIIMVCIEQ